MSRIALLGGSFNPPHVAHQMICLWALSTDQADEVWLLPCFRHPFHKDLVPFEHRVAMCIRAVQTFRQGSVTVSRVEEELGGESRTLFTVQHLVQRHPEHRFRLLIGADILEEKSAWYHFEEVGRLAPPLVIGRSGYASPAGVPELPAISSTVVRQRIRGGGDVSALVPAAVLEYAATHRLYVLP
jgi:nicotinate-nucleotide adenylyltransferase